MKIGLFLTFLLLGSCSKKDLDVGDCVGDSKLFFQVITDINDNEYETISFWFKKSEQKYYEIHTNFNPAEKNSSNNKKIECPSRLKDFAEDSQFLAKKYLDAK